MNCLIFNCEYEKSSSKSGVKDASTFTLKLNVEHLEAGSSPCYSIECLIDADGASLSTNECRLEVEQPPAPLAFTSAPSATNATPVERAEHIEIAFTLNRRVPLADLANDLQVVLKRPGSGDKQPQVALAPSNYELSFGFDSSPTSDSSSSDGPFVYKLRMKEPASLADTGEYKLKLASSSSPPCSSPALDIRVLDANIFALDLPERVVVLEGEPLRLRVTCKDNVQRLKSYEWLRDGAKVASNVKF